MQTTIDGIDGYMTSDEAAARLGVGAQRVRDMCIAGQLAARKIGSTHGGVWLIEREEVERIAKARRANRP